MKRKEAVILLLLLFCLQGFGQKNGVGFSTTIQAGLLEGEDGSAFGLKTFGSVQRKGGSAGIGVGLDYYNIRSIPVFWTCENL